MKVLIIGGTRFIGRAFADDLLERGHEITLFHRGKTNPDIFPNIPRIFGDREFDLVKLGNQFWDVVIDICGWDPKHVQLSANYLKDKTSNYVFISSVSAFKPSTELGIKEDGPLQEDEDMENNIPWWGGSYGRNKVICEEIVLDVFGKEKSLIIRPGAVIGPYDNNNFFTYWVVRMKLGGEILAPGDGNKPLQFIDARDLARFTNDMVEQDVCNTFTVTGPVKPVLFHEFLNLLQAHFKTRSNIHWAVDDFLLGHNIVQDLEVPYWLPQEEGRAYFSLDNSKAINRGLTFLPLTETVTDVIYWYDQHFGNYNENWVKELPPEYLGLNPQKEKDLLAAYKRKP